MNKKVATTIKQEMEIKEGHPHSVNYFAKSFLNDFGRLQEPTRTTTSFSDSGEMFHPSLPMFFHDSTISDFKYKMNVSDLRPHGIPSKFTTNAGSNHVCRVCAKTFRASSLLDIHMRVHVGAKPFVCPMCGHRATQKGNLKLHMKKHHGADLPPHIDLVPDSGIWGHPQENALCSSAAQIGDEIDNSDTSGKRKQVAQAVSSLLNEEIVELIKKCQNNVGQGMTGRITESLEDFIRIAKRRAGNNRVGISTDNVMSETNTDLSYRPRKKRQLNSLRFKPYSQESGFAINKLSSVVNGNLANGLKCIMCGKSIDIHVLSQFGFPICEVCNNVHRDISLRLLSSQKSKLKNKEIKSEVDKDEPVMINSVLSEECGKGKLSTMQNHACGKCSALFINITDLERHTQCFHRPKSQPPPRTDKENFLDYFGLTSRSSSESSIKKAMKREDGFNPIISCILSQKRQNDANMEVSHITRKTQYPFVNFKTSLETVKRNVTGLPKNHSGLGTQKRASPGVLNMLRQTVLNSVEHRLTLSGAQEKKMSNHGSENTHEFEGYTPDASPEATQTPFRNPAMLSLAEIGKTTLDESEIEDEILNEYPDSASDAKIFNASSCKITGSLQSVLMDIQEQENGGYQCQFCPKWFKYRSVLEIHIRSHTGERPYKCPYCEYAGTQHNCLKLHVQRHHPREYTQNHSDIVNKGNESVSPSPVCGMEPIQNRMSCFSPVECPICGRVSPSPGYLKIHMRSHKKSLDHVCHVCGRGFKEYWYLTTHLKTHERELNSMKYGIQHNKPLTPFELLAKSSVTQAAANIKFQNKLLDSDSSENSNLLALHKPMRESYLDEHHSCHDLVFSNAKKLLTTGNANHSNHNAFTSLINTAFNSDTDMSQVLDGVAAVKCEKPEESSKTKNRYTKSPSHSSRRKASCPSRITSAPYPSIKSTNYHSNLGSQKNMNELPERRKSRPRKAYQGSYLSPYSSKPSFGKSEIGDISDTSHHVGAADEHDDELPLDLSCTTGNWRCEKDNDNNMDEKPLNLTK